MTIEKNRRVFMLHAIVGTGTAIGVPIAARAQAAAAPAAGAPAENAPVVNEPVKETDAYPKSMGFRVNTANVDKVKFPRHEASQKCHECQLFSGKEGEALGPCSFFKRLVPPDGWCRNFKLRKAA
jgi:High potential iron-sulfur protein